MRTKTLAIFILGFTLIAAVGLAVSSAEAGPSLQLPTPTAEPNRLTGIVTLNGEIAPAGVSITTRRTDDTSILCGSTTTLAGGQFNLTIESQCQVDTTVEFLLAATNDQAITQVTVQEGTQSKNIAFEQMSLEALQAIGAVEQVAEAVEEEASKQASAPLITGNSLAWLLGAVVVGELLLLALMVMMTGSQADALRQDAFKRQVEAMVLLGVTVAIIMLGVAQKIGSEGLVSVLAAIVGYTVGRGVAGGGSAGGGAGGTTL